MRPLPSEVITGVRQILRDTIAPELTGHARSRLDEVRAVLAQIDWDDAPFVLAARNRTLGDILARIERWRTADPARTQSIPAILVHRPEEDRMSCHQRTYEELSGAAAGLAEPLSDWLASNPADDEASSLHRELLNAL